ncbi:MAG: GAF domain-containing protein, partial [Cyanobacteria bacterium P01_F01_bin.33]
MAQSAPSQSESPLVALERTLHKLREHKEPDVLIQETIDFLRAAFAPPLIWVALYDSERHQLVGQGGFTFSGDRTLLTSACPLRPGDILEQATIELRPIGVPDLTTETRMGVWNKEAKRLGVVGCLVYPIRVRRRCVGMLLLGSELWGALANDDEKALLGMLLGQLANSLEQVEEEWQQKQTKQIETPLLDLSAAMGDLDTREQRVQAILNQVQAIAEVGRAEVYWFTPENGSFVPHGTTLAQAARTGSVVLEARELGAMYPALAEGTLVVVSESLDSARTLVGPRVMQKLKVRSLVAAPLLFEGRLLGFLLVLSDAARAWSAPEQKFIVGAAQLLALIEPLEVARSRLFDLDRAQALLTRVARSVYTQTDWELTLRQAAESLCEKLGATTCLMLIYAPEIQGFRLLPASVSRGTRTFGTTFGPLSQADWLELWHVDDAVVSEDYPNDLRLTSWSAELTAGGVRSLLAAHTGLPEVANVSERPVEAIVVLADEQPRTWTSDECYAVRAVARQLGVAFRQLQLVQLQQGQTRTAAALPVSLKNVLGAKTEEELFRHTQRALMSILETPLAAIFNRTQQSTNHAGRPGFLHASHQGEGFAISADPKHPIPFDSDPLVQQCFQSAGAIAFSVERLSEETLEWLDASSLSQILAIACMPLPPGPIDWASVLVVGLEGERQWQPYHLQAIDQIRISFCSCMSRLCEERLFAQRVGELSQLNWYKHRYLTYFQSGIASGWRQLKKLTPPPGERVDDSAWNRVAELTQGLREMAVQAGPLVKREYWHVRLHEQRVSLTKLIRYTLLRFQPQIEKQKLWSRVHGETNVTVSGDLGRLEAILSELLALAILRSKSGSRVELWSQPAEDVVELTIADEGEPATELVKALGEHQLVPSTLPALSPMASRGILNQSPGRELYLCQYLVSQMGGG